MTGVHGEKKRLDVITLECKFLIVFIGLLFAERQIIKSMPYWDGTSLMEKKSVAGMMGAGNQIASNIMVL